MDERRRLERGRGRRYLWAGYKEHMLRSLAVTVIVMLSPRGRRLAEGRRRVTLAPSLTSEGVEGMTSICHDHDVLLSDIALSSMC
jgi:hypothetical protein